MSNSSSEQSERRRVPWPAATSDLEEEEAAPSEREEEEAAPSEREASTTKYEGEAEAAEWWRRILGLRPKTRRRPENAERGNWDTDWQFLLAGLGYSISLLNVWRFPFLVYQHGGGFVVAYLVSLLLVTFPVSLLQTGLSQFSSLGPGHVFTRLMPAFQGIGWAMIFMNVSCALFYNSYLGYALFFSGAALGSPWQRCDARGFNSPACFTVRRYRHCLHGGDASDRIFSKGACYHEENVTALVDFLNSCVDEETLAAKRAFTKPRNRSSWACAFQLRFRFNATPPTDIFRLNKSSQLFRRISTISASENSCSQVESEYEHVNPYTHLFSEINPCLANGIWKGRERQLWDGTGSEWTTLSNSCSSYTIDLRHRHNLTIASPERASCLRHYLRNSLCGTPGLTDGLWCILRSYCDQTWPSEHISNVTCVRRSVDLFESFSADEFYHFYGARDELTNMMDAGWSTGPVCCFVAAWVLVAVVVLKGPSFQSRLIYATAGYPIIFVIVFSIFILPQPGAITGINFYWDMGKLCRLNDWRLWFDAVTQTANSAGVGYGGLASLASYNRFRLDVVKHTALILFINAAFSIVTSFFVFGTIGFFASEIHMDIADVLAGADKGLVFVVVAQALVEFPGGDVFVTLFCICLSSLVLDTQFITIQVVLTFIQDQWIKTREAEYRRATVYTLSAVLFVFGIPGVSNVGMEVLDMAFDAIFDAMNPVTTLLYVLALGSMYGPMQILKDYSIMAGVLPPMVDLPPPFVAASLLLGGVRFDQELCRDAEGRAPSSTSLLTARTLVQESLESYKRFNFTRTLFTTNAKYVIMFLWFVLCPCAMGAVVFLKGRDYFGSLSRRTDASVIAIELCCGLVPVVLLLVGGFVMAVRHHMYLRGRGWRRLFVPTKRWGPACVENRRDTVYDPRMGHPHWRSIDSEDSDTALQRLQAEHRVATPTDLPRVRPDEFRDSAVSLAGGRPRDIARKLSVTPKSQANSLMDQKRPAFAAASFSENSRMSMDKRPGKFPAAQFASLRFICTANGNRLVFQIQRLGKLCRFQESRQVCSRPVQHFISQFSNCVTVVSQPRFSESADRSEDVKDCMEFGKPNKFAAARFHNFTGSRMSADMVELVKVPKFPAARFAQPSRMNQRIGMMSSRRTDTGGGEDLFAANKSGLRSTSPFAAARFRESSHTETSPSPTAIISRDAEVETRRQPPPPPPSPFLDNP